MAQTMTEELERMADELETLNKKSFKGTCTIESAKCISDIATGNSREQLFNVVKDLYDFTKKVLNSIQTIQSADAKNPVQDSSQTIENAIKKQLNEILPGLLIESLSKLPVVHPQPVKVEEKSLPTMHTLTVKKKPEVEQGESPPISKNEWTEVVRRDLKGTLKSIPVQKASLSSGTATLRFASKDHLEEAEKALTNKYKVSPKSEDQKKLEPKLTISDLDPDIVSKEELYKEILEENKFIKDIDGANKMKVIFLDKKDNFAVVQVSNEIREAIRKNGDRIHLGLQSHHVRDRFHVVQCYHCQEFGHTSGSKYCKSKDSDPTCCFCAGSHASRECTNKKDNKVNKIKCSNCSKSRNHIERTSATTHKAWDTLCPFYVREKEMMMSRTMGCTQQTKNSYRQRVQELRTKLGR